MCPLTSRRHQNIVFGINLGVIAFKLCDLLRYSLTKFNAKHDACAQRRADFNGGQCRCKQRAHGLFWKKINPLLLTRSLGAKFARWQVPIWRNKWTMPKGVINSTNEKMNLATTEMLFKMSHLMHRNDKKGWIKNGYFYTVILIVILVIDINPKNGRFAGLPTTDMTTVVE